MELKNPTQVSSLGGWEGGPQRRVNGDKPLTLLPASTGPGWEGGGGVLLLPGGEGGSPLLIPGLGRRAAPL